MWKSCGYGDDNCVGRVTEWFGQGGGFEGWRVEVEVEVEVEGCKRWRWRQYGKVKREGKRWRQGKSGGSEVEWVC